MADVSDPQPRKATPKVVHRDVEYGSIEAEAALDRADSGVPVRPTEPWSGSAHLRHYRIMPPSISGHGRLIAARRTVPYWIGVVFVLGAFAWAVLCAVYMYRLGAG